MFSSTRSNKLYIFDLPFVVLLLCVILGGGKNPLEFYIISAILFFLGIRRKFYIVKPIDITLLAIIIWSIVLFFTSSYLWGSLKNFLKVSTYVMFFHLCLSELKQNKKDRFQNFLYAMIFLSLLQSGVVIWQFINSRTPYGLFPYNPNFVSSFILACVILFLGLILFKENRWYFYPPLLLGTASLAIIGSRGALLFLFLGSSYLFLKRFKLRGIFLPLGIIFILVVNENIFLKLLKYHQRFSFYRPKLWNSAMKIIKDHPIDGVGPGNYANVFNKYNFPIKETIGRYKRTARFAHNEYLQICSEMGIPMLILLFILIIIAISFSLREKYLLVPILVMLGQGLFNINLHLPANIFLMIYIFSFCLDEKKIFELKRGYISLSQLFLLLMFIFLVIVESISRSGNVTLAAKLNPLNDQYHHRCFEKTGDARYLRLAQMANPENPKYYSEMGFFYLKRELYQFAASEFEKYITRNPFNPFSYYYLGFIQLRLRDIEKARKYFLKARSIEPFFLRARLSYATCLQKLGKTSQAEMEYRKIYQLHSKLANLQLQLSKYEKELTRFDWDHFIKKYIKHPQPKKGPNGK